MRHRVEVGPLPSWVPAERLLGEQGWEPLSEGHYGCHLHRAEAADLVARLKKLGLGGHEVQVRVSPRLPRKAIREGRTAEARRMRQTTPGFSHPRVRYDEEGRWSLTPEALALDLGRRANGRRVVDACCGLGGNAIGFARAGCAVTAVEIDAYRLSLARHNARLYGVEDRIRFVQGDATQLDLSGDILFVDAPWGRDYDRIRAPLDDLSRVLLARGRAFEEIWLKLPPSIDPADLPEAGLEAWFGRESGDRRRVKFILATLPRSRRVHPAG